MCHLTRLLLFLSAALAVSTPFAGAQAVWQPTPPPTVSAENETWYRNAEPIIFSDAYYYQAGAPVFFNRYQMVRSGSYRGIPLYTDSTQDSFNVLLVPIGNGLLQPYERRRNGALAGTTGNRAPSFPTSIGAEGYGDAPPPVTLSPQPSDLYAPLEPVPMTGRSIGDAPREPLGTVARPKGINGVWITYEGKRWFAAGKAVPLGPSFRQAGSYHGFPVYRGKDSDTIYIPTAEGMAAPYSTTRRQTKNVGRE